MLLLTSKKTTCKLKGINTLEREAAVKSILPPMSVKVSSQRKEFVPEGANSFLLEKTPFQIVLVHGNGRKTSKGSG